jgi:hypothetical protein
VAALDPDVLALQELDRFDDLLAALTPLGYQVRHPNTTVCARR